MAAGPHLALQRRFQLLTVLMGGGRPRADDLARRFGVRAGRSTATWSSWSRTACPSCGTAGAMSCWRPSKARPIQFQPDEVLALMAALDFGRRKRPVGGAAARSAWEKLLAVLPAQQQELASGLGRTLVVDPIQAYSLPPSPDVEAACRAAVEGPHPLRILYQALHAEAPVERVVRPYGMAYRGTALYLIGFCELRQEVRIFHREPHPGGAGAEHHLRPARGLRPGAVPQRCLGHRVRAAHPRADPVRPGGGQAGAGDGLAPRRSGWRRRQAGR